MVELRSSRTSKAHKNPGAQSSAASIGVTTMTTFGDVRSALMSKDLKSLSATMTAYNDPLTPKEQMRHYVKSSLGADRWVEMLALNPRWKSGYNVKQTALEATTANEDKPLLLLTCGIRNSWEYPKRSLQIAVLPIRHEAVDRYWRPWANEHGLGEVTKAIDRCLELTQMWIDGKASSYDLSSSQDTAYNSAWSATQNVIMSDVERTFILSTVRSATWDSAWSAAWRAAWADAWNTSRAHEPSAAWDAAMDPAWRDRCNRVNITMIKGALL